MPLTPGEAALESKAEKIARIITRQYGVTVRVEGRGAYMDLKNRVIVLPNLTEDVLGKIAYLLDGYLDHECSHALFTDGDVLQQLEGDDDKKILHLLWNVIEDCWVEKEMAFRYLGCGQNIEVFNNALTASIREKWETKGPLTRLLFAVGDCLSERSLPESFFDDPLMGSVLQGLLPELAEGKAIRNSFDGMDLARRVFEKIRQFIPPPPPEEEVPTKGDRGTDEEGPGQSVGIGDLPGDEDEADHESPATQQAREFMKQVEDGDLGDVMDAEGFVNDHLLDIPEKDQDDDPEEYLIFSEEFDEDTEYGPKVRALYSDLYRKLKAEVHEYIGTMATTLELALAAEAESRWIGGARGGKKFDKRRLPQWSLGGQDDRIFRQLEQGENWDTAVSLLWDCSASMGGNHNKDNKSYLARLAAIAFHEALTRAGIMHEVLGFNTGGDYHEDLAARVEAAEERGDDLSRYCRTNERDERMIFVPWGVPDGRALCRIDGSAANRDGECVLWAAKRLAARPEARKILIVGSDGHPNGTDHQYTERKYLQDVVKKVIYAGIEVYALGIMSDSVAHYYPHWVPINSASDLPRIVMQQLAHSLFARKGTGCGQLPKVSRSVCETGGS